MDGDVEVLVGIWTGSRNGKLDSRDFARMSWVFLAANKSIRDDQEVNKSNRKKRKKNIAGQIEAGSEGADKGQAWLGSAQESGLQQKITGRGRG